MILVDTSVLIDFFKNKATEHVLSFQHIIAMNIPFGISLTIYQELLQGVATEKHYLDLKRYLDTQRFYYLLRDKESYADAARIYFRCRKEGVTISSTIDCLIAQTAIENNLELLHNDSDYDKIGKIVQGLKIYRR